MNIGLIIVEKFSEISTVALHIYFLYRTLEAQGGTSKQLLTGSIFLCVCMAYYTSGCGYRPYFSVIAGIIYACFTFIGQLRVYFVWTIFLIAVEGIVDACFLSLYLLFPNTNSGHVNEFGIIRIIIIIAAKTTLFIVYTQSTRKINKSTPMTWRDCFSLLVFIVGCWVHLELVFQHSAKTYDITQHFLLAACSIALLLMMTTVVALYNRLIANGKELAQSKLNLITAGLTQEHIIQINDIYTKLSTIRHDLKGHFSAIAGYLNAKDYSALERYIGSLTEFESGVHEYVKHPVVNALLSSKLAMAKEANIDFLIKIEMPDNLPITDVDLCILISNILDNAFEATRNSDAPQFINFHTRVVSSYWVIVCHNTTRTYDNFRATGSLKSTKDATDLHGIGTKQIQQIAENYGGFVTYSHEKKEFKTLVTIRLS